MARIKGSQPASQGNKETPGKGSNRGRSVGQHTIERPERDDSKSKN